jgi:hypothetical protein
VSDNPVELVLLKLREIDKYIMAHHALADLQAAGQLQYYPATSETAEGTPGLLSPSAVACHFQNGCEQILSHLLRQLPIR